MDNGEKQEATHATHERYELLCMFLRHPVISLRALEKYLNDSVVGAMTSTLYNYIRHRVNQAIEAKKEITRKIRKKKAYDWHEHNSTSE